MRSVESGTVQGWQGRVKGTLSCKLLVTQVLVVLGGRQRQYGTAAELFEWLN